MISRISGRGLVVVALAGLALFILRDVLFFGQAFFERDLVWLYYPQVEALVRAVGEGTIPLRDPTIGFGQPILASPDTQVLYPPAWIHLVSRPEWAYALLVLFHFLLGATGAAALCFRMSRSAWGSFVAGAFWIASGPFQSALNLWHHFAGTAWVPWVLVAFDRALEKPGLARAVVLGTVFGMQILAGSADLCAMSLLLALIRLLCEGKDLKIGLLGRVKVIGAALSIALCLGAGVWMPVVEIVGGSGRGALSRESRTEYSVHPWIAMELAVPWQPGALTLNADSMRVLSEGRPPFLKSLFLGSLAFPLMGAGLLNSQILRRHRLFLALGFLGLLLSALGRFTPFYDALTFLLPPLRLFRYPVKATLALSLTSSVLAGIGAAQLSQPRMRRTALALAVLLALAGVSAYVMGPALLAPLLDASVPALASEGVGRVASSLFWSTGSLALLVATLLLRREVLVRCAVMAGIAATLFINRETNFTIAREALRFQPAHLALLRAAEPGRLFTYDYLSHPDRLPEVLDPRVPLAPEAFIAIARSAFMAPTGGQWKIEYGWDYDQKALFARPLAEMSEFLRRVQGRPPFLRLLQLSNVTQVADFFPSTQPGLALQNTVALPSGAPLYIYSVESPLPRAYAVSGAQRLAVPEAQAMIVNPSFDPHREVVLSHGPATPISPGFAGGVQITERRSDRIVMTSTLNEPGHVVLVEGFLTGWKAEMDGAPIAVDRANALFLSVEAPAGVHTIVFSYRPRGALTGFALTLFTVLALLVGFARGRWTRQEVLA